jgi:hypothetical protein
MGFLTLVDGMPEIPHVCAICAGNPYDEATGEQRQAIFAEGVDIDFGGALYICMDCAHLIANLIDRVPQEGYDRLQTKYENLYEEHEALKIEHEELKEIVDQIRSGAAASRRLKERASA